MEYRGERDGQFRMVHAGWTLVGAEKIALLERLLRCYCFFPERLQVETKWADGTNSNAIVGA